MKRTRCLRAAVALALAVAAVSLGAQSKGLSDASGHVGLGLALRHLSNTGTFLYTGAHPDDENNALLVMLERGQGYRTALFTCTRGSGGQNEIGPELFEALAVLRTEELASVHAFDGSEQYYGREIDFGFSFSIEETFEKWGREEVTADYVRIIRMVRPDVIVTMRPTGEGGGQHHQAQARITGEAFRLAADPSSFPAQIDEGLRPWQARKLYYGEGFGQRAERGALPPGLLRVTGDVYDALLGKTYQEIGGEARSQHKCQGMAQLLPLPSPQAFTYRLGDTTLPGGTSRPETHIFDGVDTTLPGLARFVSGDVPEGLKSGLAAIVREADAAQAAYSTAGTAATVQPLAAGLGAVRALRTRLASLGLDASAAFEIDSRLARKEEEFSRAIILAQGLRVDVLADDGLVFGGQAIKTTTVIANRGPQPVQVVQVALAGFEGDARCEPGEIGSGRVYRCESAVHVPAGTKLSTPYWRPLPDAARYDVDPDVPFGAPFRPSPFRARLALSVAGSPVTIDAPVQYRYEGTLFSGEKRMELLVVPRYSVSTTPDIAIIPAAAARPRGAATPAGASSSAAREVRVTVVNGNKGPAKALVSLQVPAGWVATPASAGVEFAREDESETVRFAVAPPPGVRPGEFKVQAVVRDNGERFGEGYQVIEYPHIRRRHRVLPAETALKVVDVSVTPGLKVGYVVGVGDQVPPAIEQLGASLRLLGPDELAWGDLSQYDAIVTGVRAYERRADLRANNERLIRYVEDGGTLIVQYNKYEFNEAQYGPYPAKVGSNRVTDETAPVTLLQPDHPVFRQPNRIDEATWRNWVQERGLYFLADDKDTRYTDLVSTQDPFPFNPGVKKGALVEARVGRGRWVYVGLGLWRQLPAGTDGAYRLLSNLLSLGKASKK